ncbi:hypothetical protein C8J57DRAFT_1213094 [Mycena rebaudengoi]|nr:hypothetical protein C8J57DRAFT_1213094 [Mycena rebaudengoi]
MSRPLNVWSGSGVSHYDRGHLDRISKHDDDSAPPGRAHSYRPGVFDAAASSTRIGLPPKLCTTHAPTPGDFKQFGTARNTSSVGRSVGHPPPRPCPVQLRHIYCTTTTLWLARPTANCAYCASTAADLHCPATAERSRTRALLSASAEHRVSGFVRPDPAPPPPSTQASSCHHRQLTPVHKSPTAALPLLYVYAPLLILLPLLLDLFSAIFLRALPFLVDCWPKTLGNARWKVERAREG